MAEKLAASASSDVAYIATARVLDDEMRERVALHRAGRPPFWITVEEPLDPARVLREDGHAAYVLDCVTLWLTNLVLDELGDADEPDRNALARAERRTQKAVGDLLEAARASSGLLVTVTNELGCGIVPENALARFFRDAQGRANQRLAAAADKVIYMVCGLPLVVRPQTASGEAPLPLGGDS